MRGASGCQQKDYYYLRAGKAKGRGARRSTAKEERVSETQERSQEEENQSQDGDRDQGKGEAEEELRGKKTQSREDLSTQLAKQSINWLLHAGHPKRSQA